MPTDYLKINNLFPTDEQYNAVVTYKRRNIIPKKVKNVPNFKRQYDPFTLKGNTLYYDDLEVVRKGDITEVLQKLYDDPVNSLGVGIVAFYKNIRQKYLNIRRSDVNAFLQTQTTFQMTRPIQKRIDRPILADYPNQMWCLDLIDVSRYKKGTPTQTKYVLDVVDVFSRKCWLFSMTTKTSDVMVKKIKEIKTKEGILPNYILCDNGTENIAHFATYCEENNIGIRYTQNYSPQSNGVCERMNKEVRKKINEYLIRNGNEKFNWGKCLQIVEDNINATHKSATNTTPNMIYSSNKHRHDINEDQMEAIEYNENKNIDRAKRFKEQELNQGDYVRVKMSALYSTVRKMMKEGDAKHIIVSYSPIVFRIVEKIVPRNARMQKARYVLKTLQGHLLVSGKGDVEKRFTAQDLLFVPPGSVHNKTDIDMKDAKNMNKVVDTPGVDVRWIQDNE